MSERVALTIANRTTAYPEAKKPHGPGIGVIPPGGGGRSLCALDSEPACACRPSWYLLACESRRASKSPIRFRSFNGYFTSHRKSRLNESNVFGAAVEDTSDATADMFGAESRDMASGW